MYFQHHSIEGPYAFCYVTQLSLSSTTYGGEACEVGGNCAGPFTNITTAEYT